MKKLRECENDTLLVALLLAGILMVMGSRKSPPPRPQSLMPRHPHPRP